MHNHVCIHQNLLIPLCCNSDVEPSVSTFLQILRALSRRLPLAPDVDLCRIAEGTEGLTGGRMAGCWVLQGRVGTAGMGLKGGAGG